MTRVLLLATAIASATSAAAAPAVEPQPLARMSFVREDGRLLRLADVTRAHRPRPRVWLVRVQAGWCGTCRWSALDTHSLLESFGARVGVVDVLLADEDNAAPGAAAIRAWRSLLPPTVEVVADPDLALLALRSANAPLPWLLLVDRSTLGVRAALSNPDPDTLANTIRHELGEPSVAVQTVDGLFTRDQWGLIGQMRLPPARPPDPTNRVADDSAAASLGQALFSDRSLSPSGRVACSSCHQADLGFTNGKDTAAEGVGPGSRNVPSLVLASHARWQLWDGRADTLWAQALIPLEDPNEAGSSRLFVAHAVADRHRARYEAVFGALPPLADTARFPVEGKPGDSRWDAMRANDQRAVSTIFANVGKAIAAFERSLKPASNALDRYAAGDTRALDSEQKQGLHAFFVAGCAQCHWGPRLTDDAFHNLRFPTGRKDGSPDPGRAAGIPLLLASEFSRAGAFSDQPVLGRDEQSVTPSMVGGFKTPGLRGVAFTMPYGHGGGFGGLASVIEAHRSGGMPAASRFAAGTVEPWAQGFDPGLATQIQQFLAVLRLDVSVPLPRP